MTDSIGRTINYLRISVTDRCNLRCVYCMPPDGVRLLPHSTILSYDEITNFAAFAVSKGIRKIRITGGEPLVRRGIEQLIAMLAAIDGLNDLSLTTNGHLLQEKAALLKSAGLHRVNISLDTLDRVQYSTLTRGGNLQNVLLGILAAQRVGLSPVKINCVINIESSEKEDPFKKEQQEVLKETMRQFAQNNGLHIRFIRQMSLVQGNFSIVEGGSGGDCSHCNRLRLTANGMIKPCLFSHLDYDIRSLGYEEALASALRHKPFKGTHNPTGSFYGIGG